MNGEQQHETPAATPDLSSLVIPLLKGVIYREEAVARNNAGLWSGLLDLQARVRDYVAVLGLELVLDEAEGYAFLRARNRDGDEATAKLPRLVARRPLSFPVSLLLALLRKKLAEFDAGGGQDVEGVRLVLSRDDIVELIRVFLPEASNEARLMDRVDTYINKVVELGFLRRMKPVAGQPTAFEVRRILKAFVDAQWLADLDARLAAYRAQLVEPGQAEGDA
ncbi:MAG: DUF4194 domain-containing protein [Thiogranum sp.]